ncbi:hypothetical protein Tco_0078811 [Tanacetum coccineum]
MCHHDSCCEQGVSFFDKPRSKPVEIAFELFQDIIHLTYSLEVLLELNTMMVVESKMGSKAGTKLLSIGLFTIKSDYNIGLRVEQKECFMSCGQDVVCYDVCHFAGHFDGIIIGRVSGLGTVVWDREMEGCVEKWL